MTNSVTYTASDVQAVFAKFHADLNMAVQSSALQTLQWAAEVARDLTVLAVYGVISSVHIMLFNAVGSKIRQVDYIVMSNALEVLGQRPEALLWPRTPNGRLNVIVYYNGNWTAPMQAQVASQLSRPWSAATDNAVVGGLTQASSGLYASSSYGLRKTIWE